MFFYTAQLNRIENALASLSALMGTVIAKLDALSTQETKNMTTLADVTAALAALLTNVQNLDAAVQAELAAFKTAQANNDPVAMQTALNNIAAASATLVTDTTELTASLTPTSSGTVTSGGS